MQLYYIRSLIYRIPDLRQKCEDFMNEKYLNFLKSKTVGGDSVEDETVEGDIVEDDTDNLEISNSVTTIVIEDDSDEFTETPTTDILSETDINSLNPSEWVNDEIIMFFAKKFIAESAINSNNIHLMIV